MPFGMAGPLCLNTLRVTYAGGGFTRGTTDLATYVAAALITAIYCG